MMRLCNIQVGCSSDSNSSKVQIIKLQGFFLSFFFLTLASGRAVNVVSNLCSIVLIVSFWSIVSQTLMRLPYTMFLPPRVTIYIISCYSFNIGWATKYAWIVSHWLVMPTLELHCCAADCLIWILVSTVLFIFNCSSKHLRP